MRRAGSSTPAGLFGGCVCACACLGASAAGCSNELPPLPEALVVVDTDLPAPGVAGRLRIDFFAGDGTWFDSRDIARPDPSDWPTSFSVYSQHTSSDSQVLLRLRVYPDDLERAYQGERFADKGVAPPDGPGPNDLNPRLLRDGRDITPATEPLPTASVDRLVLLGLHAGTRGRVRVTLSTRCAGTMAMLSQTAPYQTPVLGEARTCVDTEATRAGLVEEVLESDMSIPSTSQQGTFANQSRCDPRAPPDPRAVCVPEGVFVLGSPLGVGTYGGPYDSSPERIVALHDFWLDREEVTVGQLRAAAAAGLSGVDNLNVTPWDAPLGQNPNPNDPVGAWCTYSDTPIGREDYAVFCITWQLARAYCTFVGGDLPTEAQWDYAALAAGRAFKTSYPWGNDTPSCDRAVFGRGIATVDPNWDTECTASGVGPLPVTAAPGDVTPLGIHGMFGGELELLRDAFASYADPCWEGAPLWDATCSQMGAPQRSLRGNAWYAAAESSVVRRAVPIYGIPTSGFRCVFDHAPGIP